MSVQLVLSLAALWGAQAVVQDQADQPWSDQPAIPVSWVSFTPDETIAVFGQHDENWDQHRVMMSVRSSQGWQAARPVEIDGAPWPTQMRAMRFSPDGRGAVFSSAPLPGETRDDWDLWYVHWHNGRFVAARRLESPVNSSAHDVHASIAANGTIYFASRRRGGAGESDLYRAIPDLAAGWRVERLRALSSAYSEADIYVAPDEEYVIFARTDAPDGQGGDDLYISRANGEGWSDPVPLGEDVNSPEYEYGAWVNATGDLLWFTAFRDGIYQPVQVVMPEE
ncbi:MAG: hypothetical protein VX501_11165 [Pseudomonadota bacterium]|nr:hypothetical protein [Pseudomonadota bacterium]